MFTVDDATAAAIRRAYEEGGEMAAMIEFRRHFPLIQDPELVRSCMRAIAGWTPPASEGGAAPPTG